MYKRLLPFAIPLIYGLIVMVFLRGIITVPGIFMGGDWGFPLTTVQMQRYADGGLYTWSDREILGVESFFLNSLPVNLLIGLLGRWGITGDIYTRALLVAAFVFPAASMYAWCRFLRIDRKISLFAGFLLITTPIFFNYAAMGWLFVLFSAGILPLFLILFIKSVKDKKLYFAIAAGILYSLAMVQSQTFVWYPLVLLSMIPYLVPSKKEFAPYIKSFLMVTAVFLILNAYWYLPLFLGGGSGTLNTNLGTSTISLGTWARLNPVNILRLWGSLFNEQYESSTHNSLAFLTFTLPFVAYTSIRVTKTKRLVSAFVLLSLVPIILFKLGPSVIVQLPFSDLIRDMARFLILSSFAVVTLAALALNSMWKRPNSTMRPVAVIAIILLVVSTYPFWRGELYAKQQLDHDVRLRTYVIPPDYLSVEKELSRDNTDTKVLYLPIAGELSLTDDKRFYGTYKGIRDISASFSPKPGMVGLSDRVKGLSSELMFQLAEGTNQQEVNRMSDILSLLNVKYIVVRKNMTHPSYEPGHKIADALRKVKNLRVYREWDSITIFVNTNYLPHLYIPSDVRIAHDTKTTPLKTIISAGMPAIYYRNQNSHILDNGTVLQGTGNRSNRQNLRIEHRKINPTKYHVSVQGASQAFSLVFSEAYHSNWKVFAASADNTHATGTFYETWFTEPQPELNHFAVNGYANSWIIDPDAICQAKGTSPRCKNNPDGSRNLAFIIEFLPQRYFYQGLIVSATGLILLTGYIGIMLYRHKTYEKK